MNEAKVLLANAKGSIDHASSIGADTKYPDIFTGAQGEYSLASDTFTKRTTTQRETHSKNVLSIAADIDQKVALYDQNAEQIDQARALLKQAKDRIDYATSRPGPIRSCPRSSIPPRTSIPWRATPFRRLRPTFR